MSSPGDQPVRVPGNPTERDLEYAYPWIHWTRAIPMHGPHGHGLGCRFCIAMHGIAEADIPNLPQTNDEFVKHMLTTHNREADQGPTGVLGTLR